MRLLSILVLVVPAALAGCDNSCQNICDRMARYAEDECGVEISADEIADCKERQAGEASREDRDVCRAFNNRGTIEEEWDQEDLCLYWGRSGNGDDGEPEGGENDG